MKQNMKKIIRQNNNFNSKVDYLKKISIFLVSLFCFSLYSPFVVLSYFNSQATLLNSTFTTGTLDIVSNSSDFGVINLDTNQNYSVINQGSLKLQYEVVSNVESGSDTAFCNQLNITITKGSDTVYSGALPSLALSGLLESYNQDDFVFTISDPSSSAVGQTCNLSFTLKAWQPELDFTQGFTDQDSSVMTIYSNNTKPTTPSDIVLNEFLPYPNGIKYGHNFGDDSSDMPKGEWVELYNNGPSSLDLTGWYIRDSYDNSDHKIMIDLTHTGFSTPTISSHGFLVVYMNKAIFNNESGDSVRLFDNSDDLIDSHSYDLPADYCNLKPTEGDTNDETGSGVGSGCTSSIPDNKSYARIPDGTGSWVDPIPTPGESNELGEQPQNTEDNLTITEATNNSSNSDNQTKNSDSSTNSDTSVKDNTADSGSDNQDQPEAQTNESENQSIDSAIQNDASIDNNQDNIENTDSNVEQTKKTESNQTDSTESTSADTQNNSSEEEVVPEDESVESDSSQGYNQEAKTEESVNDNTGGDISDDSNSQ